MKQPTHPLRCNECQTLYAHIALMHNTPTYAMHGVFKRMEKLGCFHYFFFCFLIFWVTSFSLHSTSVATLRSSSFFQLGFAEQSENVERSVATSASFYAKAGSQKFFICFGTCKKMQPEKLNVRFDYKIFAHFLYILFRRTQTGSCKRANQSQS